MVKQNAVVSVSDSNVPQIEDFLKVEYNKENQQVTSARALWEWLGVETKFADWFWRRVQEYGFEEDVDFTRIILKNENNSKRGPKYLDFAIKLGMAKELSMAERTEKGKATRKYFLKCEEQAKSNTALPTTYLEALEALVKSEKEKEAERKEKLALENKVESLEVELADAENEFVKVGKQYGIKERVTKGYMAVGRFNETNFFKANCSNYKAKGFYDALIALGCVVKDNNNDYRHINDLNHLLETAYTYKSGIDEPIGYTVRFDVSRSAELWNIIEPKMEVKEQKHRKQTGAVE